MTIDAELEAIAQGLADIADECSRHNLAGAAIRLDDYAERLRGRAIAGVPEHVDEDTTTGVAAVLDDDAG
jgi:hypothetical protein